MHIEKVKICEPILKLVSELEKKGYITIERGVSAFHFHEMFINMNEPQCKLNRVSIEIKKFKRIYIDADVIGLW